MSRSVGLLDLINYFPNDSVMIELGSYSGESAEIFLKSGKIKKLYCVDPWLNGYDDKDVSSWQTPMSVVEKDFDSRVAAYNNLEKVKKSSFDAVNLFKDESIDVIYIDAKHTYEDCKRDILSYFPKIKKNGFISGHDYVTGWIGVMQAVNYVFAKPDNTFMDGSWIVSMEKFCKNFNEKLYLERYDDVVQAIRNGQFVSGLDHWLDFGRYERRKPI